MIHHVASPQPSIKLQNHVQCSYAISPGLHIHRRVKLTQKVVYSVNNARHFWQDSQAVEIALSLTN